MIKGKENNSTRGQLFACFYCGQAYMSYTQRNEHIDYEIQERYIIQHRRI
jgi:hypothetical protein